MYVLGGRPWESNPSSGTVAPKIVWTSIEATAAGILCYSATAGSADLVTVELGNYKNKAHFQSGSFTTGWTSICSSGDLVLFYNGNDGSGALVAGYPFKTIKSIPKGQFSTGWTHVVASTANPLLTFFYNKDTGAGAICEYFHNPSASSQPQFAFPNDFRTTKLIPGLAKGWSHVVPLLGGDVLFYNQTSGDGVLATFTRTEFTTKTTLPAGTMHIGWTHIVRVGDTVFLYNSSNGMAAIGFNPILRMFQEGSFENGWSHIVAHVDPEPGPIH
jgi:hypothetical protein